MKITRRTFVRSALGSGLIAGALPTLAIQGQTENSKEQRKGSPAKFNMCGYRAPAMKKVRVGFIGLGMRGPGAVRRMSLIEGVEIIALCDKLPERVEAQQALLAEWGFPKARGYSGSDDAWKRLCEDPHVDLVYICTPWALHTSMAVEAMRQGKHAAVEVPAALTVDEAWELVETSESKKRHCMMLENCCYDFFELLTLNMARQGFFGELVHGEGAYIHDLVDLNFRKDGYADMWRLKENEESGSLYPTHGLGPVCQAMNINRGDQLDYLTSMSSDDFSMGPHLRELAASDEFYRPFEGMSFRGNMNVTNVRTRRGRTISVQHDVSSPRPYSRIHLLSGTKGIAQKWPLPARIALGHQWLPDEEMKRLEEQFTPNIVRRVGAMARKIGGHGGMDFLMDWRLIDCLRNGLPLDQDVYDAALWSVFIPVSKQSVAKRSAPVDIPDFTRGAWKTNKPLDLELSEGGTTGVRMPDGKVILPEEHI